MNESDLNLLDYCVAYREYQPYYLDGFKDGAEWQAKQSIEVLSSILENWVHGGDADCIIAEFEEKLNDMINQIKLKNE